MPLHLILGGARSGKSSQAEKLAAATGAPVTYIATARAGDEEMRARIAHHRAQRPAGWTTVEAPVELAAALRRRAAPGRVVVVDCLTLWLTNLLFDGHAHEDAQGPIEPPAAYARELDAFLAAVPGLPGTVLCVSNEIGFGVVPLGAITRFFADEMGRLNQAVAARANRVTLMVAGLPLDLKA